MSQPAPRRFAWADCGWLVGYAALIAAVVVSLVELRRGAIDPARRTASQQDWQAWREDVPKLNAQGTVRRGVPKSAEPPRLVLLRDHFPVLLTAAVVFASLLYAALALMIRGAFSSHGRAPGARSCPSTPSSRE